MCIRDRVGVLFHLSYRLVSSRQQLIESEIATIRKDVYKRQILFILLESAGKFFLRLISDDYIEKVYI